MDFKQLESFVNVVHLGSFSKTADKLYLTQPTISAHISALEKEIGTPLIIRTTKEVFPSEAGKIFCAYARDLLKLRDDAKAACQNYIDHITGLIHIASSSIPSQYVLPGIMAAFREEYPGISFHTLLCDSGGVVENILAHRAEIGLCGTTMETSKCIFEPFLTDQLVIIAPNSGHYRSIQDDHFSLKDLVSSPFIIREEGSGTRKETESFLKRIGLDLRSLNIVAQIEDPDAIKRAVGEGLGISIMSKMAISDYANFGLIRVFHFDNVSIERKLYLVRHKSHPLSPAAAAFINFVKKHYTPDANT